MGVIVTIAVVLVAWCVCALVVGVLVGRAIALKPSSRIATPSAGDRSPTQATPVSVSRHERI